ncbi:hypothetical protein EDD16DRAFT_1577144 [Pisolithus croceorrhizus]|nr:hypothetical protein EDD16DRAFT_1577144 [Pisolithus croceorrhizus]KAI6123096.1 hypothetical protein EV401DRAFT_1948710 [Pisolithus croceorrhizus]KAI6158664.1 hypothetical protein EDD17DRAFT_1621031 [Pisolithus thermaeus]
MNPVRCRGCRIGINRFIWFFQAAYGQEGEGMEFHTLLLRCCRCLRSPLRVLSVLNPPPWRVTNISVVPCTRSQRV